jgi:hypothetical protein
MRGEENSKLVLDSFPALLRILVCSLMCANQESYSADQAAVKAQAAAEAEFQFQRLQFGVGA